MRDQLRKENVNVFTLINDLHDVSNEIDRICADKSKHTFVIIDDYKSKLHILSKFKYQNLSKVTFVLTARRAVNPTNVQIINSLNIDEKEIKVIFLDTLERTEIDELAYVIQTNSLYSLDMKDRSLDSIKDYIENECHARFSSILLKAYNSSDIKARLIKLWADSNEKSPQVRHLAVIALIKAVMGVDLNIAQMLDLLEIDFVLLSGKESPLLNEFFNFDGDDIKIKSSVVARELLKTVIGIENLIETMKKIIYKADLESKTNYMYEELLKNLVSHSHFRIFSNTPQNQERILKFYDDIRNYTFCQNNLFFWEQFASACIDCQNYSTANQCLKNAYTIAKEKAIMGFVPFHITNIQARCLIEELLYKANVGPVPSASEAIEILVKCHNLLLKHYENPENNVSYTFRVAYKYVSVFNLWKDKFNAREKSIFIEKKTEVLRLMKQKETNSAFIGHPLSQWIKELESCK